MVITINTIINPGLVLYNLSFCRVIKNGTISETLGNILVSMILTIMDLFPGNLKREKPYAPKIPTTRATTVDHTAVINEFA
jgi:hypothetical protein